MGAASHEVTVRRHAFNSGRVFDQIAVIGVGLIGGSLSLAIKKQFPSVSITGVDTSSVLRAARRLKLIDRSAEDFRTAVATADLVILSTPVGSILSLLQKLAPLISSETIVMDTGSVKGPIVRAAGRLFRSGNFVGGHPMAGSEESGVTAARADLFDGAPFILCPSACTSPRVLRTVKRFLTALGAYPVVSDAEEHDELVGTLSHLPQLVAVGLANVAGRKARGEHFSGKGLRDMTRLAASPYRVWRDILALNRKNILEALGSLQRELKRYEQYLRKKDMEGIRQSFERANRFRESLEKKTRT